MSKRILSVLRWDMSLQYRYGFYYVSLFVIVLMVLLLSQIPVQNLAFLLPVFVLSAMMVTTFYFMGALVLLEKGENALYGLVVTPLRAGEFLLARVTSLTGLAVVETLLIVVPVYGILYGYRTGFGAGLHFNPLWLLAGMVLLGALYSLLGFVAIAPYDAVNEYLLPSVGYLMLLMLPLIDYAGLWQSSAFYLHPVQPALRLLRAAFMPVEPWQIVYGLVGSLFWTAVAFAWARRAFQQFVVRAAGV
jgi:fluoroquinolone transport system permease protein